MNGRARPKRRRRRKASPSVARRRPPKPKVTGRPDVLVLGKSPLAGRLTRAVRALGVHCRRIERPVEVEAASHELTKALLIVPPIPSFSVLTFAQRREARSGGLPIFVVMEGPLPRRTVRKLYDDGVEAVFEWPDDRPAVKRTIFRLCSMETAYWGRSKSASEIALEETARAHLNADAVPFGAHLGVQACGRFLVLRGTLDALWKLELARQIVSDIPGVEDVVADGVQIVGQARSDQAIANAIRAVLRHASAVEGSTLAVSVRSGEATLTGSVRDKQEAARALELVRHVRGVRRVHDYLVVSAPGKTRDAALARRVRAALKARYPDLPVALSVFGNVAVLSGKVPRAAVRDHLTTLVYGQEGVERVVDKLSVVRARR